MDPRLGIGEHFEAFVRNLVASGRYPSADEVMRDGLRLLEEREKSQESRLAFLRSDLAEGMASGPSEPLDMAEIKAAARSLHSLHAE